MVMDGFYGQSNLVEKVLGYDVGVIVAGGVGITPYLSLVSEFCSLGRAEASSVDESSIGDIEPPRGIELHWICRDSALVDYVKKEYFAPLTAEGSRRSLSRSIRIVIHFTGRERSNGTGASTPDYSGTADIRCLSRKEAEQYNLAVVAYHFHRRDFLREMQSAYLETYRFSSHRRLSVGLGWFRFGLSTSTIPAKVQSFRVHTEFWY